MSDEPGSFIMYNEHWGGIGLLTNEQRGVLLQALMAYNGANCKMPEMDQATACIFAMIQPRMDANRKKYQETIEKRKEGGKLGGRPSAKPQGSEKNLKVSEKTSRFSEKPQGSEKNPVSVSDPVSVNDFKDSKDTPLTPQGETQGVGVSTPAQTSSPLKARETPRPDPEPKPTPETPAGDTPQAPDTTTAPQVDTSHGNPCWKEFCYVFSLWPIQQGKEKAWREYAYLRARHLVPESYALAESIERFKAEDRKWKRNYVPLMANWLRDRRWDDQPDKAPAKSYAPDENGSTPYVDEHDQDYTSSGFGSIFDSLKEKANA